jgi:hypothetical protein
MPSEVEKKLIAYTERLKAQNAKLRADIAAQLKRTMFDEVADEYRSRGIPVRYAAAFLRGREAWTWADVGKDIAEILSVRDKEFNAEKRTERAGERGGTSADATTRTDFVPTRGTG